MTLQEEKLVLRLRLWEEIFVYGFSISTSRLYIILKNLTHQLEKSNTEIRPGFIMNPCGRLDQALFQG